MPREAHPQHPDITEDMWKQIDTVIQHYQGRPGSTIPVLRECQNVVGYLPVPLIHYISQGLNRPRSEVFGVATFYSYFSLIPKGRHVIKVCLGTACYVKGIKEVMTRIERQFGIQDGGTSDDRRFTLQSVRCLGACGLAPVMVVNNDVYGDISADQVIGKLETYQ